MKNLTDQFAYLIQQGTERLSIRRRSEWAERYIHLPCAITKETKPLSFDMYPHSRGMCDMSADVNITMKAAQMACTNSVLYLCFADMDMKGHSVLYVLPNKIPDAGDFSVGRVNLLISESPHLDMLFTDVRNDGLKRAGTRSMWIRGANSTSGLKNIDPNIVVLDEYDEMSPDKVELAVRRSDGQMQSQLNILSTPRIPEQGIHEEFLQSTQQHFRFVCPICNQKTELVFPDCLVVCGETLYDPDLEKSHVICERCKKEIPHERKIDALRETGYWEATETGSTADGWYINQLSSCVKEPPVIARTAIKSAYNPASEQEYWNSHGGLPHVVAGARLTDPDINACKSGRRRDDRFPTFRFRTMGVDVGKVFHWVVMGWNFTELGRDLNLCAEGEIINMGWEQNLNRISILMRQYQVPMTVFDSEPDVNGTVYSFCNDHRPNAMRCKFARGQVGKMLTPKAEETLLVNAHKTHWMDLTMGRYVTRRIKIPKDTPEEFNRHLKNVVKHYSQDESGDVSKDISKYKSKKPDHWALASCYAEMALPIVASQVSNKTIRSLL